MSGLPKGWAWSTLEELVDILDSQRIPVNRKERDQRPGDVPYYGATGQVGTIDDYLFDETLVLLGEDGAPFLDRSKPKAYIVRGKSWVNNHAHVLRAVVGATTPEFLMHQLNAIRYEDHVNGTTRLKLTQKSMRSIRLAVPPLPEQRRIVAAIEEHVSRLDAGEASLRVALRREAALSQSILSTANDPSWPEVSLGDLLDDIEAGKSFKTPGRPAEQNEWGVIKVSAMTWGEFDENENKAVLDVDRIDPRYQIERGDLLLSRANTSELVGAAVLVGDRRERLLLSDKSMRLITKPEVDRRWLRYCLGSPAL